MNKFEQGFDTQKYVASQKAYIHERLHNANGQPTFMEFGGKPFGDNHAERVLPGYDADCKAEILSSLLPVGKIVMVVNAKDILLPEYGRTLRGRIRGDSQLRYDDETIRLIKRSRELDLDVKDVVVAVSPRSPSEKDRRALYEFREDLFKEGVTMHQHYEVSGYPDTSIIESAEEVFQGNDVVAEAGNHLIAFSPGGGSGKFGVLLSEMYHALRNGQNPNFIKFETFPIFTVDPRHALNLAFEAATADLQNRVVALSSDPQNIITSYDKDVENYALLKGIFSKYQAGTLNAVDAMTNPTSMSVNRILDGITDEDAIVEACRNEITRRIARYTREVQEGNERQSTLDHAVEVMDIFNSKYPQKQLSSEEIILERQ
jgi:uncharacterized protein (UPF0371 family)